MTYRRTRTGVDGRYPLSNAARLQANTHRGTATIKERNLAGRRWLWADEFGEEPYRDGQSLTNKTAIASSA
ncbi:hypothetical protein T4B_13616 [Trichinella pseudospiralis]|uniref:Uncharacterized protein n=1 Tax=Trichinella pseudospiralis TaxID=6337 RepID=A0A0V1IVU1_TRIPS|nr:hypothetical protein T4B_13616 [Trichinella pseudospiralis]